MKKRQMMAVLMCAALSVGTIAPAQAIFAEEAVSVLEESEEEIDDEDAEEIDEETDEETDEDSAEEIKMEYEEVSYPTYTALDYVKLGEYKGLTVEVEEIAVTEEEVDERISEYIADGHMEEVTEGTVKDGDVVNIDYEGKKDDVAFDGGTSEDYDLEIGSGSFIEGFEEGLIGAEIGSTVDLNLTFPEDYHSEDLAGQDVVFTVKINHVSKTPELTDELASELSEGECETVDTYRESIEAEISKEKEEERVQQINDDLLEQIVEASEISELPEELVNYVAASTRNYYKQYAEYYGVSYEEFLSGFFGMTEAEFEEQLAASNEETLPSAIILKAIAETEGIELTEDEYNAKCKEYADEYGYASAEEFIEQNDENEIRSSILQNMVLEFLREQTEVTEVPAEETEEIFEEDLLEEELPEDEAE